MDKESISLAATLSRLAEQERQERGTSPPAPEELVAYHEGELDESAREALQSRLALDPDAAREYLDLKHFGNLQPPDDENRLSERDVETARARILARIQREEEASREPRAVRSARSQAEPVLLPRRGGQMFRIAAVILAMVAAGWIALLYRALEERSGPRFAPVIDLNATRGARPYLVPSQAERIHLIFHGAELAAQTRGELEITTDEGEVIRSFELEPAPAPAGDSLLNLTLPRSLLPDGTYRAAVFRLDAGSRRLVKEYRWTVTAADSP